MKKLFQSIKLSCFLVALIFMISCSDDEPAMPETPEVRVAGSWESNTSTGASFNLTVSSILTETDGVYSGPFFITSNFTPAYGSNNDGTISFKIEGGSILEFTYIDTIPGCEGSFNGTGEVDTDGNFSITFTGSDCDGIHNGTMMLDVK